MYGTGNETVNGTGGMKGIGNVSGALAGNGTGAGTGAVRWTDCWSVGEGVAGSAAGAEGTGATGRVGDAAGRRDHLRQPCSPGWAGLVPGKGGRAAGGSAGQEEWRGGEGEGGRTREEKGESGQSCGC